MGQPVQNITNRTLSGLFWTSLATTVNVISLLLVLIVLARLLTPADFGLAAAALMVIGLSAIFADFGVGPAIVQRCELRAGHVCSGFTLSLCLGALFGALTWLAAPLVADFFQLEQLRPILRTLAVIFPLQATGVVADSLLQRELRFRVLAIVDVISLFAGYGVVGIALAVLGCAAWALVGAHMTQAILRAVLLLCIRPHQIFPLVERKASAELIHFGVGFTASRFSNYFAGQAENLVIGRWLGPVALGVYSRAYQLMAAPAVLFGNVLDRVLFPTMVHVQKEPKRLADAYRRGTALIALVILPLSAVVVSLAPEVVGLLLGSEWNAVILPLQILGVGMLFRTGCKTSDSLVRATGAVYRRTWRQTAYAVLVFVGALIGQMSGVEGVAVAVLATLALNFFLMAHLALSLTAMSWRTFAAAHVPGLALAALLGLPVAAAAVALRACGAGPLTVLLLSSAAIIPAVPAVICMPNIFLGRDGRYMIRKLIALILESRDADRLSGVNMQKFGPLAGLPIKLLRDRLADAGVRYCRWKRNVDLQRVLSGAGDLDLLVHRLDADNFLRIAEEQGFKRVTPRFAANLAREAQLYGLDPETGALLHLHANFELVRTPICFSPSVEEFVLHHCAPDQAKGLLQSMPVVRPEAELIVFVLRAMEQYASPGESLRLAVTSEWLQGKLRILRMADPAQAWHSLLKDSLPADACLLFADFLTALADPASWFQQVYLARRLQRKLATGSPLTSASKLSVFLSALWRLWHGRGSPKQLPCGGCVLAFVGPDASGKSTMVAESARWLGRTFPVVVAHLGKPPSTYLTLLPNFAGRLLGRVAPRLRTFHQRPAPAGTKGRGQGLLYRLRAVLLAWDRRALALRLARKAQRGWLVICDRYPTACVGAPDSARLRMPEPERGLSWLHTWVARIESRLYRDIPEPAIVLRLNAPLALTVDRNRQRDKPGKEGDDFVARRHNDFFMPPFGDARIIVLDASTSQQELIAAMRRQLWQALCWSELKPFAAKMPAPHLRIVNGLNAPGDPQKTKSNLVVEFIGPTGVGKSTLISAVVRLLTAQGLRVGLADEVILRRFRLACPDLPKVQSAAVFALSLRPFCRYFLTRQGSQLSRMAVGSIMRGMGNPWIGANLIRNFIKRIGSHFLLEGLRGRTSDYDIVIWDEGAVHAAHNLFVHNGTEPKAADIEEFGRMVPKPDALICVTAPIAQLAKVLLQRGHSRVDATPLAANTFVERAQTTFKLLACAVALQGKVYQIDNSWFADDQKETGILNRASAISTFLSKRLQQRQESLPLEGVSQCLTA
jgi:O-antigen/teichoic acid export membrane protein/thymidylate kinase/energy-coupling factor transporter ATP-binding protein EcfA2